MKMLFLLYFLTSVSGEAVEAFEADAIDDVAITAFQASTFAHSF
jgi:hypothetical protein